MKKKILLPMILLTGLVYLNSCGEATTEEAVEEVAVREINKELDALITDLAACEQQNTNCEAYTKASEGVEKLCSDETKRNEIIADLFYVIQMGPSARSQAAAHAVNFWVGTSDFFSNAEYGRIVLDALKNEKYEQDNYTGSQLGQLLSGWLVTDDKELLTDLVAALKDQSLEMRGRSELIRLSSASSFANGGVFNAILTIAKDTKEDEAIREQALNVLWRAEDATQKQRVRSLYESNLSNPALKIAGSSLTGLGYMKSLESYALAEETIRANKDDKYWYSYGSRCLGDMVQYGAESIDLNAVFALTKEMLENKTVEAYYRSYYIGTLAKIKTPQAKSLLKQLMNSREKEIAEEAKRVAAYS